MSDANKYSLALGERSVPRQWCRGCSGWIIVLPCRLCAVREIKRRERLLDRAAARISEPSDSSIEYTLPTACAVQGCEARPWQGGEYPLCLRHWTRVPRDLRREVIDAVHGSAQHARAVARAVEFAQFVLGEGDYAEVERAIG